MKKVFLWLGVYPSFVFLFCLAVAGYYTGAQTPPNQLFISPDGVIYAALQQPIYQLLGDGTDRSAQFKALRDANTNGLPIGLPAGTIGVSSNIDWGTAGRIDLRGAGMNITTIKGNVPGDALISKKTGSGQYFIRDVGFVNQAADGMNVRLEAPTECQVTRCKFRGNEGLVVGLSAPTNVGVYVTGCYFDGNKATWPNGIGAAIQGQGHILNCEAFQWAKYAFLLGHEMSVSYSHCENNAVAFKLGLAPDGVTARPWGGEMIHVKCEANGQAVSLVSGTRCGLTNVYVVGETQMFPCLLGIEIDKVTVGTALRRVDVAGAFSDVGARLKTASPVVLEIVNAGNSTTLPAVRPAWDTTGQTGPMSKLFTNCP